MAGSYKDCIAVLNNSVGDLLSEEQKNNLLERIDDLVKKKKAALDAEDLDSEVLSAINEETSNEVLAAIIEKRNRMLNLKARKRILHYTQQFKNPVEGLKSYMVGTVKLRTGGRFSVDAQGKALTNKYLGRLIADLEDEGLLSTFTSGALDREVARELWEIRPDGNPGITKNQDAKKLAEIIHKYQTLAVDRQNRAGAFIRKLPGYIVRQAHDTLKVRRAGYEDWRNFVLPRLDESTFKNVDDREEFLKSVWEALSSGIHLKSKGGMEIESGFIRGFKGARNLAKRLSVERLLHFRSADDWYDYNNKFGTSNVRESVVHGLEHAARNTVLMENFGTNPLSMFETVKRDIAAKFRTQPKVVEQLKSKSLESMFKELEGSTRIPVNLNSARISAGIRVIQNMSKLGGAVISSITDIPSQVAEMRYQGISPFKAYANALSSLFTGRGTGERKELARLLGVGFEGLQSDIMSRFSPTDNIPGVMSKLQQRYFKLNLMSWWNDSHRTGVGHIMSNNLAEQAKKSFDQLDDKMKRILGLFDINNKEWDAIRSTVWTSESGYKYITPDKVGQLDDKTIAALAKARGIKKPSPRQIAEFRDNLELKLQSYFVDRADSAVPMPGASERAFMNMGTEPGTVLGETLRFFWQFKSFPITVIHRVVGRELFGSGAENFTEALFKGKGDLMGLANYLVATTMFGYNAMVLKDLVKGREPRAFNRPSVALAAMAQGGGLGIYGDFLFGEYSRYGNSALVTLAGPTIGQFDDFIDLWQKFRDGDDLAASTMRVVMNNTPFINLFYTRIALDYLILYRLQEMANPGYLRRMERRLNRDQDQKYIVPPSTVIERGG